MNKLKEIRTKYKISQAELARRLDTTQGQVCRLEISTRQLTENWLERLSKALGCTKAELLGEAPTLTQRESAFLEMLRKLPAEDQLDIMAELHRKIEQRGTNETNIEKKIV